MDQVATTDADFVRVIRDIWPGRHEWGGWVVEDIRHCVENLRRLRAEASHPSGACE